jgi:hypothetical protein
MPPGRQALELLSATSWDVRTSAEAQVRTLTALQGCIEEYRRDGDPDALAQIARHLATITTQARQVIESLSVASESLAALKPSVRGVAEP